MSRAEEILKLNYTKLCNKMELFYLRAHNGNIR